ncbi:fibronectin type III domain-containing protein [Kibdelosporangium phytohabitans]|uniref:Fibronectin type-III domain-containing protein n=1 Tax=Kibdelosporangium phytohabitans TaxID=860235 RepID=A0A0N9I570_9PSEU|nr:fibronectin type III domain-containing protein [Kibdelosporangium phytohabitans]ALG11241.1 hypothetical protein AOZ06_34090 [Kibdelosporangium phytohabitans]MBE1462522.1 hypothetical protein [Kibdelosporangium phytohabitans]
MISKLMAVSLVVLAGCSAGPTGDAPNLTADLVTPVDVDLSWRVLDAAAAGQVVEYANEEKGDYTVLDFLPVTRTTYQHTDLIPQTRFFYRIRSYYGTASAPVAIGEGVRPPAPPAQLPVRDPQGAPTDLVVTATNADNVTVTWTDRTSDEEGFIIEVKANGAPDFAMAAMVGANLASYELGVRPEERKGTYRIRPYAFGASTNIAGRTTGSA